MRALMFMDDLLSICQYIILSLRNCSMFEYIVKYSLYILIDDVSDQKIALK